MKIFIIGSTSYKDKMLTHQQMLVSQGHESFIPALDDYDGLDEKSVCDFNRSKIEWADEVHVFWDARSSGTIFDVGMCFAMKKPIKLIYVNSKTFINLFKQLEERGMN